MLSRVDQNFLAEIRRYLHVRGNKPALLLCDQIRNVAMADPEIAALTAAWGSGGGKTLALFRLSDRFGDRDKNAFFNAVTSLDSAALRADRYRRPTTRSVDGRLFGVREKAGGWYLSIQADKAGYGCDPRADLPHLEDYNEVEVRIGGPFEGPIGYRELGLPQEIVGKFAEDGCARNLTWDEVNLIEDILAIAAEDPHAGVPRGRAGWSRRDVWHGTDEDAAADILANGPQTENGKTGQGRCFHAFPDQDAAEAGGDVTTVVTCYLDEAVNILDLRNAEDAAEWDPWSGKTEDPNFDRLMRRAGIDGVYDPDSGCLSVYKTAIVNPSFTSRSKRLEEEASPGM